MEVAACGFAAYYDYSGAAPYELHCECLRCVLQRPQRRKALQLILIAILWPFLSVCVPSFGTLHGPMRNSSGHYLPVLHECRLTAAGHHRHRVHCQHGCGAQPRLCHVGDHYEVSAGV